jgi:hypothetical protein
MKKATEIRGSDRTDLLHQLVITGVTAGFHVYHGGKPLHSGTTRLNYQNGPRDGKVVFEVSFPGVTGTCAFSPSDVFKLVAYEFNGGLDYSVSIAL